MLIPNSKLDEGERRDTRRLFLYGDGAREGVAAGLLVVIGGFVLFSSAETAWLSLTGQVVATLGAAVAVGGLVGHRLGRMGARRRARLEAERRAILAAERERQLAEVRAARGGD